MSVKKSNKRQNIWQQCMWVWHIHKNSSNNNNSKATVMMSNDSNRNDPQIWSSTFLNGHLLQESNSRETDSFHNRVKGVHTWFARKMWLMSARLSDTEDKKGGMFCNYHGPDHLSTKKVLIFVHASWPFDFALYLNIVSPLWVGRNVLPMWDWDYSRLPCCVNDVRKAFQEADDDSSYTSFSR